MAGGKKPFSQPFGGLPVVDYAVCVPSTINLLKIVFKAGNACNL
jgi:hypothetical protein